MCLHQRLQVHCHPATSFTPLVMSKIKQGGLRVPSMQCNVKGDDEALSLNTMKETEWLNHMRQNVEDHQHTHTHTHTHRERGGERERERETKRICNPLLPSKLEMEQPLTRTQQQ